MEVILKRKNALKERPVKDINIAMVYESSALSFRPTTDWRMATPQLTFFHCCVPKEDVFSMPSWQNNPKTVGQKNLCQGEWQRPVSHDTATAMCLHSEVRHFLIFLNFWIQFPECFTAWRQTSGSASLPSTQQLSRARWRERRLNKAKKHRKTKQKNKQSKKNTGKVNSHPSKANHSATAL